MNSMKDTQDVVTTTDEQRLPSVTVETMRADDVDLMSKHMLAAVDFARKAQARLEVLRGELYIAARRVEAAEASRDIVRASAQAALEKYRRQDQVFRTIEDAILSPPAPITPYEWGHVSALKWVLELAGLPVPNPGDKKGA